jgi:hypothetical protein
MPSKVLPFARRKPSPGFKRVPLVLAARKGEVTLVFEIDGESLECRFTADQFQELLEDGAEVLADARARRK